MPPTLGALLVQLSLSAAAPRGPYNPAAAGSTLSVVDFGAVARLPEGLPRPLTIMTKFALENRPADLIALLRDEGFLRAGTDVSADDVLAYLAPFTEPLVQVDSKATAYVCTNFACAAPVTTLEALAGLLEDGAVDR